MSSDDFDSLNETEIRLYKPSSFDSEILTAVNLDSEYALSLNSLCFANEANRVLGKASENSDSYAEFIEAFELIQQASHLCLGLVLRFEGKEPEHPAKSSDMHNSVLNKLKLIQNPKDFFVNNQNPEFTLKLARYTNKHLQIFETAALRFGEKLEEVSSSLSPQALSHMELSARNINTMLAITRSIIEQINIGGEPEANHTKQGSKKLKEMASTKLEPSEIGFFKIINLDFTSFHFFSANYTASTELDILGLGLNNESENSPQEYLFNNFSNIVRDILICNSTTEMLRLETTEVNHPHLTERNEQDKNLHLLIKKIETSGAQFQIFFATEEGKKEAAKIARYLRSRAQEFEETYAIINRKLNKFPTLSNLSPSTQRLIQLGLENLSNLATATSFAVVCLNNM